MFVPRGYEDGPVRVVGTCNICGQRFEEEGAEQAWQEHVGACAKQHMDRIQADVEKRRKSIFNADAWDPEIRAHMDKVGERMIEEGRLEVRPNERAGF